MPAQPKYILLTLGEELLLGLTKNTHLTYIGDQLRQGGQALHANVTLSDAPADIEEHFRHYWEKADVLITTGGLGPTIDDRTKEVIAQALEEDLVFDQSIQDSIEERFAQRGLKLTQNNRKQALRLEQAVALPNPNGTAPGLWLEKADKILIMLPGPPQELRPMFESEVVPRLRKLGLLQSEENYLQIRTAGVGESALETLLQPVLRKHEGLEIAFCAHPGMVDFRLSLPNDPDSRDTLIEIGVECQELLGDDFVCCGQDSIVQAISKCMRHRDLSLAVAESCTGGLLASEITNLPGSSEFFLGGLTTYSSHAKEDLLGVPEEMIRQHSPVSSEVAIAMALGVAEKLEADYALSVTGYLGPGGGTEANPVGTIFIGLHSPRGTWAKRFSFGGTRIGIKQRALNAAMDWLRRELTATKRIDDQSTEALRAESKEIIRSLK